MVKQKIVLKVSMEDPKKRSKVLQTATGFIGVISASLEGDRIVVVGDGVDAIALTTALRKRMRCAELINVTSVETKKEEKKAEKKDEKKEEKKPIPPSLPYPYPYPYPYHYVVVVQESSHDPCHIM